MNQLLQHVALTPEVQPLLTTVAEQAVDLEQQVNSKKINRLLAEQAHAQHNAGTSLMSLQQYEKAREAFRKALHIKLKLQAGQTKDVPRQLAVVADSRAWLSSAESSAGFLHLAIEQLHKIYDILNKELLLSINYIQERIVLNLITLAILINYQGKSKQAYGYLTEAYDVSLRLLITEPDNVIWRKDNFNIRIKMLALNDNNHYHNFADCLHSLSSDLAKYESILAANDHHYLIAQLQLVNARQLIKTGAFADGQKQLLCCKDFFSHLRLKAPIQHHYSCLAESLLLEGEYATAQQDESLAQRCYQQVIEQLTPLLQYTRHPRLMVPYAKAMARSGQLNSSPALLTQLRKAGIATSTLYVT